MVVLLSLFSRWGNCPGSHSKGLLFPFRGRGYTWASWPLDTLLREGAQPQPTCFPSGLRAGCGKWSLFPMEVEEGPGQWSCCSLSSGTETTPSLEPRSPQSGDTSSLQLPPTHSSSLQGPVGSRPRLYWWRTDRFPKIGSPVTHPFSPFG